MKTQKINVHSSENQNILDKFVDNNIYLNVSEFVEFCIQNIDQENNPIDHDNAYHEYYPEYEGKFISFEGGNYSEWQESLEEHKSKFEDFDHDDDIEYSEFENEIEEFENLEQEYHEVFEYWAVSRFLFERLQKHGEVTIETGTAYIWGRCTTGQAILLDTVIGRIGLELEILV